MSDETQSCGHPVRWLNDGPTTHYCVACAYEAKIEGAKIACDGLAARAEQAEARVKELEAALAQIHSELCPVENVCSECERTRAIIRAALEGKP
jgi:hypothetical protein